MDRLQQKCFIGSAGFHLLLAVVLVVGPAFLSPSVKEENLPPINCVPSIMIDQALVGGGNPNAKPPEPTPAPPTPPTPTPPPPQTKPEAKPPEPVRPPEPILRSKPEPESLVAAERPKQKPQINTNLVSRQKTTAHTASKTDTRTQNPDRQWNEARQRLAGQLARAAENIRQGTSATTIEDFGPGGGGPVYASYAAWVKTVYENAWVPPDDTGNDSTVAYVSITIARDGAIISAAIVQRSGDPQVDASVQRTLDRVSNIGRSFPEGVKDKQRSYKLKFDLKAKRGAA